MPSTYNMAKEYRLYRWANGEVRDIFVGDKKACKAYCEKWADYKIEWCAIPAHEE